MSATKATAAIDVEIRYQNDALVLRIVDDGCGFDVTALSDATSRGHFGLAGMRERAETIHAQLEVSSRKGAGTQVELRIPASIAYQRRPGRAPAK